MWVYQRDTEVNWKRFQGQTGTILSTIKIFILKNLMFYLFLRKRERERDSTSGEGQKGRHRIWSRVQALSCQHRARHGAQTHEPWDYDLSRNQTLNWTTQVPNNTNNLILYTNWIYKINIHESLLIYTFQ